MTAIPTAQANPTYLISPDTKQGVIRMRVEGFYDLATLKRHFFENEIVVERWRSEGRPIRVLIDATNLMPHSPEGQAFVQESTMRIYVRGDRVAIVVASSLVKMQMRRALSQGEAVSFFVSESAAITWLTAYTRDDRLRSGASGSKIIGPEPNLPL